MNTTDLLLQMTLAATQIAQNTTPPVSGRTEDAGDRRDFSTLLAEKRVEAAGTETGRAVPESQKGEVPAAADGGALSQGAQSVPQAPGLEELFRSLLMGAQAAPEGDVSLQQVPQTAVPGMAQAPAAAEEGAVLLQPGQQNAGGGQLPVPAEPRLRVRRSPRSRRRSFLPRRMVVQPRPRRLPLRPGRAARRPRRTLERRRAVRPAGSRSCPSWTVCRRRGRRSRSLTGQSTCR